MSGPEPGTGDIAVFKDRYWFPLIGFNILVEKVVDSKQVNNNKAWEVLLSL